MTRCIKNKKHGFTLIETLVAIVISSLVLSGFITLVLMSMKSLEGSKGKYLAAKIAQEGLEIFINKRDNNLLCVESGCGDISDWKENLVVGAGPTSWEVEATSPEIDRVLTNRSFAPYNPPRNLCKYTIPPNEGKFGYCGNPADVLPGEYRREIRITRLTDDAIRAESIVKWKDRGIDRTLGLEEILFGAP